MFDDNSTWMLDLAAEAARRGAVDEAVSLLSDAALSMERHQVERRIPAAWEAVGRLLQAQSEPPVDLLGVVHTTEGWTDTEPLDMHVVRKAEFEGEPPRKKQALAFEWSAQHLEQAGDFETATPYFINTAELWATYLADSISGQPAPRTMTARQCRSEHLHIAWSYSRALLNYVRANGTGAYGPTLKERDAVNGVGSAVIGRLPELIDSYYLQRRCPHVQAGHDTTGSGNEPGSAVGDNTGPISREEEADQWRRASAAWRAIASELRAHGNDAEANERRRHSDDLYWRFLWHNGKHVKALWHALSGPWLLGVALSVPALIFGVFPALYLACGHLVSTTGHPHRAGYVSTALYSWQTAMLFSSSDTHTSSSVDVLLAALQCSFSLVLLAVLTKWLTDRLRT